MRNLTVLLAAVSFGLTSNLAGQASKTAEGRQAILNYQLTLPKANELITAMDEMTRYVVSLPDFQERMVRSMKMSPEELRAQLEKDPKAIAIVKKHGLTSQDYLVGVPALRMALMAAQGLANNPNITASPANIAFAKAHLAELKPKLDAVDGIRPRP
jgi:enamine deaminase RidA (YjgF/YER057c/UK114 family)